MTTNSPIVQYHAWAFLPCGGQEYSDADAGDPADGWSVHLRTPAPNDMEHSFIITEETDHGSKEEALKQAQVLANTHNTDFEGY